MKNKNSIDIIKSLVAREKSIEKIQLIEFESYKLIQNRIEISEELKDVFNSALDLREKYKLPFWDGFNVSLFYKELKNFDFFDDILFQNHSKKITNLTRDETLILEDYNFTGYTAICSKVKVKNKDLHLPLLDFHIPVSPENTEISKNVLKHLGLKGYLLDSGKSYHFIGSMFLDEDSFKNILYKALLFTPIIDRAWISHQLIQGYSCLRITEKYERLPIFLAEIN
jgi:hypothetical protein